MKQVVIGTSNEAKYQDFALYLGDEYEAVKPDNRVEIPEGMHSLEENAIAKARTWCILTGLPALADDTGFFIEALHGEPGVAARRWGGELSEDATNEDFWKLLQTKVAKLKDTSAYVEQCVAIAMPSGDVKVVYNRTKGYVDKEKLAQPYNGTGYPLAAAFVTMERPKAWDDMTDTEKLTFNKKFVDDIKVALEELRMKP